MTPAEVVELVLSGLRGELSPRGRILTALAPALAATAYFVGGLAVFSIRCALRGLPQDAETRTRGKSLLVGFFLRHYFFWLVEPFWRLLLRTGLPANAITALSALLAVAAAVAVAAGRFGLGGWLFLVSGMLDTFDGRLARARGEASPAGSALDSVLDRYSDGVYLVGLGWYYRESGVLLAVLVALVGTSIVPYVRAKAESLGVPLRGGVMQRVERVLFLGGTVALSPVLEAIVDPTNPHPAHWLAVGGLAVVAVLSNVTSVTRLVELLRALLPAAAPGRRRVLAELTWNGLAALAATGADFALVLALVRVARLDGALATAVGCVLGAGVNFALNRAITFRSRGAIGGEAGRYGLVSATSALLNAGGVALLASLPALGFGAGWWLVRGAVWLLWSYPLQRGYVFAPRPEAGAAGAPSLEAPRAPGAATLLAIALVGAPGIARAAPLLRPALLPADTYGESYSFMADLADGTYVQVQLSLTNLGPGSENGICRALVVPPSGKAWADDERLGSDDWGHAAGADGAERLHLGACSVRATAAETVVEARLDDGLVRLTYAAPLRPETPPDAVLRVAGAKHRTEVLLASAPVVAQLTVPGRPAREQPGAGYADHSRSDVPPKDLAVRWVRFRAVGGKTRTLVLGREGADGFRPVWRRAEGAYRSGGAFTLRQSGEGAGLAFEAAFRGDAGTFTLRSRRLLHRHAPIEELGLFGNVVRPFTGSPVTYTLRAVLAEEGKPDVPGILEVSLQE